MNIFSAQNFQLNDIQTFNQQDQIKQNILSFIQLSCIINFIVLAWWAVGLVLFIFGQNKEKRNRNTEAWMDSEEYFKPTIHVRYVTKGTNRQQILESCYSIKETIRDIKLTSRADWHIEVLTDNFINLGDVNSDVNQIVVPDDQVTPHNSLFKSRALHQAAQHCEVSQEAWILHMDEESQFNVENGHRIADWCDNENQLISHGLQTYSFANGYIVYTKQDQPESYFWTLIDTIRVTDDHLKFSWSFSSLNRCYLGIKGSCWIIHSEIERRVGFDVRQHRSIGEDWVASLNFNEAGQPIKWLDATIEEQSPFNFKDFVKQRNRWQKANLHNAIFSIKDQTFPLSIMLYIIPILQLTAPIVLVNMTAGVLNTIAMFIGLLQDHRRLQIIPMIADGWQQSLVVIQTITATICNAVGQYQSGQNKQGWKANLLGWFAFVTPIGITLSGYMECISVLHFFLFVDKRTYEFKVINKDSTTDKYGFRGMIKESNEVCENDSSNNSDNVDCCMTAKSVFCEGSKSLNIFKNNSNIQDQLLIQQGNKIKNEIKWKSAICETNKKEQSNHIIEKIDIVQKSKIQERISHVNEAEQCLLNNK